MKRVLPFFLLLPFGSCLFHYPAVSMKYEGPFIDSAGYSAAQERIRSIDRAESDALVSQALSVTGDPAHIAGQPPFFQSIEENYQRYLKLFTPEKRARRPEIRCRYDLVETFNLLVFDPQPFINAMLHTMSLTGLVTLDFSVHPKNADTTLVHIALTEAVSHEGTKWFSFSEGELTLTVTRHGAFCTKPPARR
ncbi:MAG: hypothetical protein JXA18_09580 [Chitinispirillaceae bacterium]|nr:hypothetical protein [Chitinispirillaceae bacterium]